MTAPANRPHEHLASEVASHGITYEGYIAPEQLPPVEPMVLRGSNPDERFFIRTHQAFELWFSQVLDEFEFARDELEQVSVAEDRIPVVTQHVRRATAIIEQVRAHLPLLETLLTTDFYDFRYALFGASGFQSFRYREIEWLCGFLDGDLAEYVAARDARRVDPGASREAESLEQYRGVFPLAEDGSEPAWLTTHWKTHAGLGAVRRRLQEIRSGRSLRAVLQSWLMRTPFPDSAGPDAAEGAGAFGARFARAFDHGFGGDLARLEAMGKIDAAKGKDVLDASRDRLEWFIEKPDRRAVLFLFQFERQPLLSWPAALLEAFLALDEELSNFRYRHVAMVSRVLGGGRISTGGQVGSGLHYLQRTVEKKAMPELWDARSFLLGHREAGEVYSAAEWQPFRLRAERD